MPWRPRLHLPSHVVASLSVPLLVHLLRVMGPWRVAIAGVARLKVRLMNERRRVSSRTLQFASHIMLTIGCGC